MQNIGYCCISLVLEKQGISTNRKMIKRTFNEKGLSYVGQLAYDNLCDLLTTLRWNVENGIRVYRVTSNLFPWMSEYQFEQLPNFHQISQKLNEIGQYILENGLRVSFHPGQFNVLCSRRDEVVAASIVDLDQHARIFTLMGLPSTHSFPINIHIGAAYDNKTECLEKFCLNFSRLSQDAQNRLVVENDDKVSQYSVRDLYDGIFLKTGIPITFDYLHHSIHPDGLNEEDAIKLCMSTWKDAVPLFHYSDSKKKFEEPSSVERAHADYIYQRINQYGLTFDIELESKCKDLSVLKYREDFK